MDTEGEFNENTETNTTEETDTQTTETVEYQVHVIETLDNLVNLSLFNGVFLGAILGALVVSLFWKRINP